MPLLLFHLFYLFDLFLPLPPRPGHCYGFVGQNGVGKTTILTRIAAKDIANFPMELKCYYVQHEELSDKPISVLDFMLEQVPPCPFNHDMITRACPPVPFGYHKGLPKMEPYLKRFETILYDFVPSFLGLSGIFFTVFLSDRSTIRGYNRHTHDSFVSFRPCCCCCRCRLRRRARWWRTRC